MTSFNLIDSTQGGTMTTYLGNMAQGVQLPSASFYE